MKTDKISGFFKTFEEFKKDPNTKIEEIYLKIKTESESWFTVGALSKEKHVSLTECLINTNTTQPTITFEFSAPNNYYEAILKGDMENLAKEEEEKIFLLEIKKFNVDKAELVDRSENEISESDFTEDFFLQLIAKSEE